MFSVGAVIGKNHIQPTLTKTLWPGKSEESQEEVAALWLHCF